MSLVITTDLLARSWFATLAIGLVTMPYWTSGIAKLFDPRSALSEARALGLSPPWLVVAGTILVQLGGSGLLLLGYWPWLAAGAVAIFTALATIIAHPFWKVSEAEKRREQRIIFLEHAGLIGGLMLAAIVADTKGLLG